MDTTEKKKRNPFSIAFEGIHYLTGKFIGAYVSQDLADYIHLQSVYKGKSIQSILQEIVEKWRTRQKPEAFLLKALSTRAIIEWKRRLKNGECLPSDWEDYKGEVANILRKRKISERLIEDLLKQLGAKKLEKDKTIRSKRSKKNSTR